MIFVAAQYFFMNQVSIIKRNKKYLIAQCIESDLNLCIVLI